MFITWLAPITGLRQHHALIKNITSMNTAAPETKPFTIFTGWSVFIRGPLTDAVPTHRERSSGTNRSHLAVLGPLILTADLLLLLGGEVVLDVEGLADLVG